MTEGRRDKERVDRKRGASVESSKDGVSTKKADRKKVFRWSFTSLIRYNLNLCCIGDLGTILEGGGGTNRFL